MGKNIFIIVCCGFLSGLLSYGSLFLGSGELSAQFFYTPGLIFGLLIGSYFAFLKRKNYLGRLVSFTFISTLSYFAAVCITLRFPLSDSPFAFFFGGLIGTFLLLVGFHYIFYFFTIRRFVVLTLLGGILGLSWYIIPRNTFFSIPANDWVQGGPYLENFLSLFVLWQTSMTLALGCLFSKQEQIHIRENH